MKICDTCREEKSLEEFSLNKSKKSGRNNKCKVCARAYAKEHYARRPDYYKTKGKKNRKTIYKRNNNYLVGYLEEHPCIDCGETDIQVLEFDHKKGKPDAYVAQFLLSSLERLKNEIDLCEVRCSNCHTKRTRVQLGTTRVLV